MNNLVERCSLASVCRVVLVATTLIAVAGCTGLRPQGDQQQQPDSVPPSALTTMDESDDRSPQLDAERTALFTQPLIDPLTDYLRQHKADPDRAAILSEVKRERDSRCAAIAEKYDRRAPTASNLRSFKAGYAYSCPGQVAAFADRVDREGSLSDRDSVDGLSQSAKDCYLLTSIKNFSDAREACLEPAANGDARAQENMAVIEHAFENYTEAFRWAEKTALNSATSAYLLGRMYRDGHGIDADPEKAGYWLRQAADRGHAKARVMLEAMSPKPPPG